MSGNPDSQSAQQQSISTAAVNQHSSSQSQSIVSAKTVMKEDSDHEKCIALGVRKAVVLNNVPTEQPVCVQTTGPSAEHQVIRIDTESDADDLGLTEGSNQEPPKMNKMVMARKSPFPMDDDDECEDGECLEVHYKTNRGLGQNRLALYIRGISGGDKVYIKVGNTKLMLSHVSVTTAFEDVGIVKMNEFGQKEQCFRLQDIQGNLRYLDPHIFAEILSYRFGGSSDEFKVTLNVPARPNDRQPLCSFRGDDVSPCNIGLFLEQDYEICVSKVTEIVDGIVPKAAADPVTFDDLFPSESESIVAQMADAVEQNPCLSMMAMVGAGCVLFTVFKRIFKKMQPKPARRRIIRPGAAMLVQIGSVGNQEDAVYTMMSDAI